ncbi:SDR family NAD(P)-dependent oxidoreductase [Kineococcus rhizosphaerae]|uniref:Meso-butanediol dehydrogenase/(S,S)-butanediol dehydrogenase/diacetyl reductase n=1 Tax=Kineococcus rhizosphaerae TaxID=559628 RepID=A0A2T0QX94_9ACTN|nr:SDR family oxidoreductase [Kineococcus rhizosphaerae]PRY10513.1 meso-butanediol dehydrogenase/(S,S)-butanediol dehydrogenase/diacetyl reductase [Kineococcus rhizosphaerae]
MTGRLEGKVVAVTGAGSGMGRAFAVALAREGAAVGVIDLDADAAAGTARMVAAAGGRALAATADVSLRAQVVEALDGLVAEFGGLDVVFNNAGFNRPMRLLDVTEENWRSIMDVNALGCLIGIQEAARLMIAAGRGGKIVNTASIAGRQGYPDFAPYSASKAAVISLTQAAARGLAEHDITCNAFAPGVVGTPLWDRLDRDLLDLGVSERPGQAMADFGSDILRGRVATAEDITGTAVYLASADSDYLTGQVIMIDGGMVLV